MRKSFFIGETVFLQKVGWFAKENIEVGRITGRDEAGCYLVENTKAGTIHKIDPITKLEKKIWRPYLMTGTGILNHS